MSKLIMVSWKRAVVLYVLGILAIGVLFNTGLALRSDMAVDSLSRPNKTYFEPGVAPEGSVEELYQDMFVTLLLPYIDKAVADYYEVPYMVAPYGVKVLEAERPNGYRSFMFVVKLEVIPYEGAHNGAGIDHVTLRVSAGPTVTVEKFEHVKSYDLPVRR